MKARSGLSFSPSLSLGDAGQLVFLDDPLLFFCFVVGTGLLAT